jgi:serine/threonine-protein kinase
VDGRQLVVRALDQLGATPLGGLGDRPRGVFISPDGNWVGYSADGGLHKVSILGGPPVTICEQPGGPPRGASWGDDDTIVFATVGTNGLWRVPAGGGEPEELTTPDAEQGDHLWPEILPGSTAVLFTIIGGPVEGAQIAVLSLDSGETKVLIPGGSNPRYAPTGHIVYGVGGTLRAVGFDLKNLEVTTDPIPVLDGVTTKGSGAANFGMSQSGSLAYIAGPQSADVERTLVWVDRDGREEPLGAEPRGYIYPIISPDGTRLAVQAADQENDIWIWHFARETLTRLTFDPAADFRPVWTPDGLQVAFGSQRGSVFSTFWKAADGTGTVELLIESENAPLPLTFSPDGTRLVFLETHPETGMDLGVLSMDAEGTSGPLLVTEFNELNAEISPDGRWLAYQSDASGQNEIYVRPFPNTDDGRWQISRGGGIMPLWGPDGRELFYLSLGGQLTAVPIEANGSFTFGNSEVVFEETYFFRGPLFRGRMYDISPDGKRFLMVKEGGPGAETEATQLILVQNWLDELKRLVPVDN